MMMSADEHWNDSIPVDDDAHRRGTDIIRGGEPCKRGDNNNDDNGVHSVIEDDSYNRIKVSTVKLKKNKKQKLREQLHLIEEQRDISMEKNMYTVDKKLLIFDINNVLIYRSKFGCSVFNLRPHCRDFLLSMNDRFSLAIWTSMKKKTAKQVINIILGELPSITFKFIWYQPKCIIMRDKADHRINSDLTEVDTSIRTDIGLDQKPMFLKDLSIVWKEYTYYNDSNTIIVDDSVEKCSNNHSYNCIHPKPYIAHRRKVKIDYTSNKLNVTSNCDLDGDAVDHTHYHGDVNEIDIDEADINRTNRGIDFIDDDNELQLHGPLYLYLDSISRYHGSLKDYQIQHGSYLYA